MNSASRRVLGTFEVRMAYMMLAIGTLMSIVGAYAAIKGYGIVQVEEGWSSVIAGATLFTGGIVTIALGLVLRKLDQLHAGLTGAPASVRSLAAPDLASGDPDKAEDQPMLLAPFDESLERSDPAGGPYGERPSDARGADGPHKDDAYKLETPSTPEHDLISAPRGQSRAPGTSRSSGDDWLDRAFADFDQDVSDNQPIRKNSAVGAKTPDPKVIPDPAPETQENATEEFDAGSAANAGPEVIGRYEADGTSYIMYADGSIEAQTHSGVYRFASMAELKAFIES